MTDSFESKTDSFESMTDSFESKTDSFESKTDSFESKTDSFESMTDSFESKTDSFESMTDSFESMTDSVESMTDSFESKTDSFESKPRAVRWFLCRVRVEAFWSRCDHGHLDGDRVKGAVLEAQKTAPAGRKHGAVGFGDVWERLVLFECAVFAVPSAQDVGDEV
ncbi:MAG: hypothetical protein JNJ83_05245 [Verrucomicrobiaceae bacterium]|nr:hypothetical protein [Verrucomicrobiaceae bacterium]